MPKSAILQAGKIPIPIIQKYFNKWLSNAYDLFGTDGSSSAHWAYVWGLKGRVDEDKHKEEANIHQLNELACNHYLSECREPVYKMNEFIPFDHPRLKIPDVKFHRSIGYYAGEPYSVDGQLLTSDQYQKHLRETLPTEEDEVQLKEIFKDKDWVLQMNYCRSDIN